MSISSGLTESTEFISACPECSGRFYHNIRSLGELQPEESKVMLKCNVVCTELPSASFPSGKLEVQTEFSVGVPDEFSRSTCSVPSRYTLMELSQARIRGNRSKSVITRRYNKSDTKRRLVYDKLFATIRDQDNLSLGSSVDRPVFPRDSDWDETVRAFVSTRTVPMKVDNSDRRSSSNSTDVRINTSVRQPYNVNPVCQPCTESNCTSMSCTSGSYLCGDVQNSICCPFRCFSTSDTDTLELAKSATGPLQYACCVNGVNGKAFLDTGVLNLPFNLNGKTSSAFVSEQFARSTGIMWNTLPDVSNDKFPARFSVTVANDQDMQCEYMLSNVTIRIGKYKEKMDLFIIPTSQFDVILGRQWFKLRRPQINHADDSMHIPSTTHTGSPRTVIVPLYGTVANKTILQFSETHGYYDNDHYSTFASFWHDYRHSVEYQEQVPLSMIRITKRVLGELTDRVTMETEDADEFDPPSDRFLADFPNFTGKPSGDDMSEFSNKRWTYKGNILNETHPLVERPPSTELDELIWDEFGDNGKNRFPQEIPGYPGSGVQIDPIIKLFPENEHDYPCRTPRKLDKLQQKELLTQLTYYLEKGWIQPSSSPYGACILFVPKKNGKFRMCYDYRQLNKITVKDKYPLPDAEQVIEQLEGAKYFSQLDLAHGYHQCILHPSDVEKTAFRTTFGAYEWKVMTFGFCNAVPAFVRLMNTVLYKHLGVCCMVFIDDVVIYSKTYDQHKLDCQAVLNSLYESNLFVNWTKSQFDVKSIKYLGLNISNDGVTPFEDKVEIVKNWERPVSLYHLRSFLGAVGYYRKFIFNFAKIARPLTDLTKDNPNREKFVADNVTMTKFGRKMRTQRIGPEEWTRECQVAFDSLKQALCSHPVLQLPDPTKPYEIMTDASGIACGAVLMQRDQLGRLHPIAFYSSKHTDAESKYPVHEFELLAIFKALKQWRHLLVGSEKTLIYTDHKPLTHILSQDKLSPRQERWITNLADYDVDILAVKGTSNQVSDCLSRYNYEGLTSVADELRKSFERTVSLQFASGFYQSFAHMYSISGFEDLSSLQPSVLTFDDGDADSDLGISSIFSGGPTSKSDSTPSFRAMTVDSVRESLLLAYETDYLALRVLSGESTYVDLKVVDGVIMHTNRDGIQTLYIPGNALHSTSQLQTEFPVPGEILRQHCSLREEILRDVHNTGHVGTGKMIELVSRNFYWPRMRRSIADFVRGCPVCQQNKQRRHKLYGKLRSLGLPTRRWAEINIDFIVALPVTRRGFDAIMVVIDRYSKRAHFIATKTTASAETSAQLFYDYIWKLHGMPVKVISDRDPKFTGDFWRSLMGMFNTELGMSTPYHPQSDGLVERTNLTLKEMLRSFTDNGRLDWDKYLTAAEFVYNNTYNSSVKDTPFKLDTGQHPLDVHSIAVQRIVNQLADDDYGHNYDQLAKDFVKDWDDSLELAKQCISEATETMERNYNKLRTEVEEGVFQVGSKVWLDGEFIKVVDSTGSLKTRKSLDKRRLGPYKILEVLADGTALRLELPAHQKFHDVQSISRLELVKESDEFPDAHEIQPHLPIIRDGVEEYEIEKIIRSRTVRGKRQFLVKYLGYDSSFNEWKHRSQLANALEILDEYELAHQFIGGPRRRSPRFEMTAKTMCTCNGPLLLGCTCGYY